MSVFQTLRIDKTETGQTVRFVDMDEADLMGGDVTVRVTHSTINYKDGLAIVGASPVVRRFPMIPGVDFAGTVERSDHPGFTPGDQVVMTGFGAGETHFGGYAQKARVKGEWLVRLPKGLTPAQSMAIGTAGLTAMLALLALERHGLTPDRGPAVVTGAAGGVGSTAVVLLAKAGWRVIASTGRISEADYLRDLGAAETIDRRELSQPARPLAAERWAAGVDSVGSHTLANLLSHTSRGGAIAACGLAQGMDLPASVAPFILRGVSLLGIESGMAPISLRETAWARLTRDFDRAKLSAMTSTVPLSEVPRLAREILAGKLRGRTVVVIP